MEPVNISELKNRLSHYLREVRRGASILISDRDRVIARIDPVGPEGAMTGGDDAWLRELELRRTIRRAQQPLSADWLTQRPHVSADVLATLLEERADGR